jgi:hypothetical protein
MKVAVVTGYVPIPDHPRSDEEYRRLGRLLLEVDVPVICYDGQIDQCWLYQYLREHYQDKPFTYSVDNNPTKNSVAYHCVQAQKSEWLEMAAMPDAAPDVLVWIDYGIFNLTDVTGQVIRDFLQRVENEHAIAIPGCWPRDYAYQDDRPCWRFCGGLIVMPRVHAAAFNAAVKAEYKRHLRETNNLSWEVNCWARLEERNPELPLWQFRADHNASMFTAYKRTEMADAPKQ